MRDQSQVQSKPRFPWPNQCTNNLRWEKELHEGGRVAEAAATRTTNFSMMRRLGISYHQHYDTANRETVSTGAY